MTLPIPTEEADQRYLVNYLELKNLKFTAIPNSTFTKSWSVKARNTAMGVRAGFPDLVVIINNRFICIEMKRETGGTVTKAQAEWHEALNQAGVDTYVCRGFDEARKVVDSYLGLKAARPDSSVF